MKITRKGIYLHKRTFKYRLPFWRGEQPPFIDMNFDESRSGYLAALEYEQRYAFPDAPFAPTRWQRFLDKVLI